MALLNYLRGISRSKKAGLIALILVPLVAAAAHVIPTDTIIQGMLDVGNVNINTNTISTSNVNGDLLLSPNGAGSVVFPNLTADTVPYLDATNQLTSSAVTPTELAFLSGLTSTICGINDSCVLTNKTIDGDDNTVQDLGVASLKTIVGNADKVLIFDTGTGAPSVSATLPTVVQGNITSVGTITSGTWNGGVIPLLYGGTGTAAASANAAFNALSPMTSTGDIIYGGAAGVGTRLPAGSNGQVLTLAAGIPSWAPGVSPSGYDSSETISNLGIATSAAANALTIALKQKDGTSDATGGSPIGIGFRNSTVTNGGYTTVSVTGALSVVVSSGSTLGINSGFDRVYIYVLNNAGSAELAVSTTIFDEGQLATTTAEGGAGAADTSGVLYSATARTNVPIRLIGRIAVTEGSPGLWTTAADSIDVIPFDRVQETGYNFASGSQTLNITDEHIQLSGASATFTLPSANNVAGRKITLSHSGTTGSNLYTLNTTGGDDIGEYTSGQFKLNVRGETLTIASQGSNWEILSHYSATDWVNETTTVTATTTNPTKPSTITVDRIYWRREGKDLVGRLEYTQSGTTGAAAGSGDYLWLLPAGLTAEGSSYITYFTTVIGGSSTALITNVVGSGEARLSTVNAKLSVIMYDSTHFRLYYMSPTATGMISSTAGVNFTTANFAVTAHFRIPIANWNP